MEKLNKINEKLKVLMDEAKKDCYFDKVNIETQFDNTLTIMNWINKKHEWNEVYRVYEYKRKEVYKKLWIFYKSESDLKINTKEELTLFIECDTNYHELFMICNTVKEVLTYIDSVIENLKSKNFEQKRWLEHQYFINGK
jgi:hypothetical protein